MSTPPARFRDEEAFAQFDNPQFSDFLIHSSLRTYRVHKVVLYRGSEYFRRKFDGEWREAAINEVDLKEDDPLALEAVLRHIYDLAHHRTSNEDKSVGRTRFNGPAHNRASNGDKNIDRMLFNGHLFTAADKYGRPALKKIARPAFKGIIVDHFDKESANYVGDGSATKLIEAFYGTTTAFHPDVTNILCEHVHMNISTLMTQSAFVKVFREIPQFSLDYMQYVTKLEG